MSAEYNIGFIGTGGIASAMAKGFCSSDKFNGKIFVSVHKNSERADELKKLYSDKITICGSNQDVVDNSDIVVTSLLPGVLHKVAASLAFRKDQGVIHIAAGIKIAKAAEWYAPAHRIVRSVPLPFSSKNMGPIVFYGDDPVCGELLALLGSPVKVASEKDLEILASVTGTMVSYYGLAGEIIRWCTKKGLDFKSALDYTCCMHEALSSLMRAECTADIEAFMLENTTPGGTNELALRFMKESGCYSPWTDALEQIGKRYDL